MAYYRITMSLVETFCWVVREAFEKENLMRTKRLFLAVAAVVLLTGVVVNLYAESQEKYSHAGQLRQVVLFKFKDGTSPEDIAKVEKAFAALPSKIPQIAGFEWGTGFYINPTLPEEAARFLRDVPIEQRD